MSSTDEAFQRIDTVVQVGLRIARSAPTGRLLLARIADTLEPEWIPRHWRDTVAPELAAAQRDAVEPLEWRQVEALLRDAWGAKPSDELDSLEREPAAVTAMSQIHRGVLEGEPVAVKVLRPGLRASVRQDLGLLEGLLTPLSAAFPATDPAAVIREFRARVLDELDLEHEAGQMRLFHRALRRHPFLSAPAPVTRLAHEDVLVSEWIDGVPLAEAPDRDQACARLLVFVLGAARHGMLHADPDPADVLVLPDGGLVILDFGATAPVESEWLEHNAAAVEAFVADDEAAFAAALSGLGVLPADRAPAAMALAGAVLGEFAGDEPVLLDSGAVLTLLARLDERPREVVDLLRAGALPPRDLWPARGVGQLFATIARVGATGPWRELVRGALRDGWD